MLIVFFQRVGFDLIGGLSNNFIAVTASDKASRNSGIMEVVSTGNGAAVSVIDLSSKKLIDLYSIDSGGLANEPLISENISAFARG